MKNLLSRLLGAKSPVFIWWVSLTEGRRVGTDPYGNVYFIGKARKGYARERRWVLYAGDPDPTRVPPEWHAWLHYQTDEWPDTTPHAMNFRKSWQLPHRRNLTGTSHAYSPLDHVGKRQKASADYTPWTPES